jgi:Zn-finger nucleic acid-binding protein
MQAETLNCPMCGAAAEVDAPNCLYCNARLATIACPSCFGMMFLGSRHCPRCGAHAERAEAKTEDARGFNCPRCRALMEAVAVGTATVRECARCSGLWVAAAIFEEICVDREQQSAALGLPMTKSAPGEVGNAGGHVRYVPCPQCAQLMNRVNFARCSGVVVDVCKGHGTWFDRDELQRVIEFIRAGGMSTARAREIEQLSEERRQLRQEQLAAARDDSRHVFRADESRASIVGSTARELLKLLID